MSTASPVAISSPSIVTDNVTNVAIKQEEMQQHLKHHQQQQSLKDDLETMHPKLKKILKTYHSSAQKSILGPSLNIMNDVSIMQTSTHDQHQFQQHQLTSSNGNSSSHMHQYSSYSRKYSEATLDLDNWSAPPPNSAIKGCISALPADSEYTEKCETLLHGERITCFVVGGEKRLCLPEMLNYVLKDFTVQQINSVCERLHIYCSRCTHDQLEQLKLSNILPTSAPSCGLITLTDAERLCHILLNCQISKTKQQKIDQQLQQDQENKLQLKVYHCCFGRTYGTIYPYMYANINSQCIECDTCHLFYSPQNFVVHTHRTEDSRICHWGFDSSNWRLYIKLVHSFKDDHKYVQEFESFKYKFSNKRKSNDDATATASKNSNNEKLNDILSTTSTNPTSSSLFKKFFKTHDNTVATSVQHDDTAQLNILQNVLNNNSSSNSAKTVDNLLHLHTNSSTNTVEHKLLNDLLSKPITNQASTTTPTAAAGAAAVTTATSTTASTTTTSTPSTQNLLANNSAIALFPTSTLLNPKLLSNVIGSRSDVDLHKKYTKYVYLIYDLVIFCCCNFC